MNYKVILRLLPTVLLGFAPLSLAEGPMDCVAEMAIPQVTGVIMMSIPATIKVRVTIGKNGLARQIDYGDAKPLLKIQLNQYFKEQSRYRSECSNRTITFKVRYLVEGVQTPYPVSATTFHPPDEFVVVAHPIEPSLDPAPKLPSK